MNKFVIDNNWFSKPQDKYSDDLEPGCEEDEGWVDVGIIRKNPADFKNEMDIPSISACACGSAKSSISASARSITDKSITDKSITDKSITDKSITDKSITDKSITDKSISAKIHRSFLGWLVNNGGKL